MLWGISPSLCSALDEKKGRRYGAFSGHVRIHGDVPAAYEDVYSGGYGSALPASIMASMPLLGYPEKIAL